MTKFILTVALVAGLLVQGYLTEVKDCRGPHEYYACGSACDSRCYSKYGPSNCNIVNIKCNDMCYCENGYARASPTNATCVLRKDCPSSRGKRSSPTKPTCKENEVYEVCPASCPFRTCGIDDNLIDCPEKIPRPGDPDCPAPACRCKPQFFRDDKGNCVPWEQCPKCTGPNEEYNPCFSPCGPGRCDYNPLVVKCAPPPKLGDKLCAAGCRCKDGFLRNDNDVCVPQDECPCGGDPNAKRGCGTFCTRCSNYKKGPVACRLNCILGACECREGFIYDDITKKCVLPENCSPECAGDE